ncbi:MAG: flagellar biosynthetic protein FliO [Pacificimonas sp.]
MSEYLIRLLVALPLICALIVASLWIARRLQSRTTGAVGSQTKLIQIRETQTLGPGTRLAVVGFADRQILVGIDKHGMHRLASASMEPT